MTSIYETVGAVGLAATGLGSPESFACAALAVVDAEAGPPVRGRSRLEGSTVPGGRRTPRARQRHSSLPPASLLDQLVTAGVRSFRDLS